MDSYDHFDHAHISSSRIKIDGPANPGHFEKAITNDSQRNNIRQKNLKAKCQDYKKFYNLPEPDTNLVNRMQELGQTTLLVLGSVQKGKIISCAAPKAGFTTWRTVFLSIENGIDMHNIGAANVWGTLPGYNKLIQFAKKNNGFNYQKALPELKILANNLFNRNDNDKFMQVRHPLARLYSAWGDKMNYWPKEQILNSNDVNPQKLYTYHDNEVNKNYKIYKKYIEKYETEETLKNKSELSVFSFPAFLKYIINDMNYDHNGYKRHWQPQHQICKPCNLEYDQISKLESIDLDSSMILEAIDMTDIGAFPEMNVKKGAVASDDLEEQYRQYMEKIKKQYEGIDKETMRGLYEIYEWDFKLFDYEMDMFL